MGRYRTGSATGGRRASRVVVRLSPHREVLNPAGTRAYQHAAYQPAASARTECGRTPAAVIVERGQLRSGECHRSLGAVYLATVSSIGLAASIESDDTKSMMTNRLLPALSAIPTCLNDPGRGSHQ